MLADHLYSNRSNRMGHASGQKGFTRPVICASVVAFPAVVMAAGVWFYSGEKGHS